MVSYEPWLYPLFESYKTLRLIRIVHDCMLPVLYAPPLIRKMFDFAMNYTFTNRKKPVWYMVAERLACHHTPATTADELWYRVEAAWSSVSIQSLFDSIPRQISAVITARDYCFWY
ncbi:hypothetical protein TNCV_2105771 [Trichonephila clavipes]|nr:hypothetical protein TNCV_2105771 [Trichonephila clavipes]